MNPHPTWLAAFVGSVVTVAAIFVGSVTPEVRGDTLEPGLVAVDVTTPAERRAQRQVTDTLPPPEPVGLHGLPFAPAGLSRCDEMSFYRKQAGLIEHFDGVGFRESSCRNDVSSFCCHGYWQAYVSLHVRDHRLGPRYAECGVTSKWDLLGQEPVQKQRSACVALAVYEISGGGAWDAW